MHGHTHLFFWDKGNDVECGSLDGKIPLNDKRIFMPWQWVKQSNIAPLRPLSRHSTIEVSDTICVKRLF